MARHQDPLASFDVPRDWEDRTVVAYAAPPRDDQRATANIVMTRDRMPDDEDLEAYVARQTAGLELRLKGFLLDDKADCTVAERPAVKLSFTSNGPGGPLDQRLIIVALADRAVASFTLTAPMTEASQCGPLFDRMVASIRFEGSGTGQGS
ncbi:MAG: DcrB-related protein [Deltaproteobacteria bacterium]|nr:DcrB-related protein [Deltaproteobacteria bacterium]